MQFRFVPKPFLPQLELAPQLSLAHLLSLLVLPQLAQLAPKPFLNHLVQLKTQLLLPHLAHVMPKLFFFVVFFKPVHAYLAP